jgi:hypothetical protein
MDQPSLQIHMKNGGKIIFVIELVVQLFLVMEEEWWFEGKLHRIDGPAVIRPGKKKGIHKEWWIDGKLIHIEFSNGSNKWFLNGIRVPVKTQIEYDQYILTNITQR